MRAANVTATIGSVLAAAFVLAGSAHAQELTLKQEGKDTYLVQSKARLRIINPAKAPDAPDVFYLPDGDAVTLAGDSIQVQTKAGVSGAISLKETLKQWVHDDSKWGGHAFKNYLLGVYEHGGLFVGLEKVSKISVCLIPALLCRTWRCKRLTARGRSRAKRLSSICRTAGASPPCPAFALRAAASCFGTIKL